MHQSHPVVCVAFAAPPSSCVAGRKARGPGESDLRAGQWLARKRVVDDALRIHRQALLDQRDPGLQA